MALVFGKVPKKSPVMPFIERILKKVMYICHPTLLCSKGRIARYYLSVVDEFDHYTQDITAFRGQLDPTWSKEHAFTFFDELMKENGDLLRDWRAWLHDNLWWVQKQDQRNTIWKELLDL